MAGGVAFGAAWAPHAGRRHARRSAGPSYDRPRPLGRLARWRGGSRLHADGSPDAVAVVDDEGRRRRTYAELAADAAAPRGARAELGVGRGDVVSVQLPNRYETVVVAVAIQSLGAVINPLLPNYRRP